MTDMKCVLCEQQGGDVLWQSALCRVVAVDEPGYPGFCRVILNAHVREMSDLDTESRERLMRVVFGVETVVRSLYQPDKVNLASLGNVVPHLHWHVIPRWQDDRHFPDPIWALPKRERSPVRPAIPELALREALRAQLGAEECVA
ncbi:MAG: HIT family protein [Azonexus sp.]|nr:HIT family protein [Azonexus sp.]